jgi:hypothetical protein
MYRHTKPLLNEPGLREQMSRHLDDEGTKRSQQLPKLKSAEACFREGWRDAVRGQTIPLDELWKSINETAEAECDSD